MINTNNRVSTDKTRTACYQFGFIMTLVAGHTTYYHNLRAVVEQDVSVKPDWNEVVYHRPGGVLERVHDKLPFLPSYPFGIVRAGSGVYKALHKATYDAIMINSLEGIFFSGSFQRIPTIFNTDATPLLIDRLEGYDNRQDFKLVAELKYKLYRKFVHSTRQVIAWSNWARQSLVQDYGLPEERVVVNPPGVKLDYWQPEKTNSGLPGPVRVLFVGGDFRRKNGPALLEWFKQQPEGRCELHIVTREPIEIGPGIKVYYDLKPNSPELLHLYQTSDLFVLPSLGECFGIATVEAMACGLPVIVSEVGGSTDIVQQGVNGYVVPAKDQATLNRALDTLVDDPAKRQRMGQVGRKIAEQKFEIGQNTKLIIESLKEIVKY